GRSDQHAVAGSPRLYRRGRARHFDRRRPAQLSPGANSRDFLRYERDQRRDPDVRLPVHAKPGIQRRPRADLILLRPPARRVLGRDMIKPVTALPFAPWLVGLCLRFRKIDANWLKLLA